MSVVRWRSVLAAVLAAFVFGCGQTARDLALDTELARASLDKALKAWSEGKKPADLKPEMIVSDAAWNGGSGLLSFEIKSAQEWSDGTNLYLPVERKVKEPSGKVSTTEITYVVGTSPVITIFPQE